jgi:hypothetical protein
MKHTNKSLTPFPSVSVREAEPGAMQEPHHAQGLQYQRPYQRGGHPCPHAYAAVLAGEVM